MVFCMECGTKLVEGAKFCLECGTKLPASDGPSTTGKKAAPAASAAAESDPLDFDFSEIDALPSPKSNSTPTAAASRATTATSSSSNNSEADKRRVELDEKRAAAARARERANVARQRALQRRGAADPDSADDADLSGASNFATLPTPKSVKGVPTPPAKTATITPSASAAAAKPDSGFGKTDLDLLDDLFDDNAASPSSAPVAEPKKQAPVRQPSKSNIQPSRAISPTSSSSNNNNGSSSAAAKDNGDNDNDDDDDDAAGGGIDLNNVRGTTVLRIYLKKDDTYKTLGVNPNATVREVCYYYVKKMRLNTESKHFAMIEWTSGEERYMMPAEKPGQLALEWKAKARSADEKRLYFAFSEATKKRLSKPLRTDSPTLAPRSAANNSSSSNNNSNNNVSKNGSGGGGGGGGVARMDSLNSDLSDLDALDDMLDEPKKRAPTRQSSVQSFGSSSNSDSQPSRDAPQRSVSSMNVVRSTGPTSAHRIGTDPFGGKLDIVAAMQKQNLQKGKTGGDATGASRGSGVSPVSPRANSPPPAAAANPAKPNRAISANSAPTGAARGGGTVRGGGAAAGAGAAPAGRGRGRGAGAGGAPSKTNISSAADAALDDLDSFLGDFDAAPPTKKAPVRESAVSPRNDDDFDLGLDDFSSPPVKKAPTAAVSKPSPAAAGRGARATPTLPVKTVPKNDDLDAFAAEFGGGGDLDDFGNAEDLPPPPKKSAPAAAAAAPKKSSGGTVRRGAAAEDNGEFDDLLGDLAGQMEDIDSMLDF